MPEIPRFTPEQPEENKPSLEARKPSTSLPETRGEQQSHSGDVDRAEPHPSERKQFLPEGILVSPRLAEEFQWRMTEAGTNNWEVVLYAEIEQRYTALNAVYPDRKDFDARLWPAHQRGERWAHNRMLLGLTHDQIAERVDISPWELLFIEDGLPSTPRGISEALAARLDKELKLPVELPEQVYDKLRDLLNTSGKDMIELSELFDFDSEEQS